MRPLRHATLPALAAAFLAAGTILRFTTSPADGDLVWLIGLVVTGAPLIARTARGMFRGHFAADVVATLAIATAVVLREPFAGLIIVLMQSGGEALERYAEGRASAAVRALEEAAPRIAHRLLPDESIEDIDVAAIEPGDTLVIRPGELVPCDATVLGGRSHVDASRLTGESIPVSAAPDTHLMSGSANGEGTLTVRADARAAESQYARIVQLVRTAQTSKAPIQRLADRYAVWFTPITIAVCIAAWAASGDPRRALAVLVVATPCPLILAAPVAIIGGLNRAARRQIIVRHGGALEQIGDTDIVIFDKTGTLTIGRPEVERVLTVDGWTRRDVLRLAGAVEQGSSHLLARTLVAAAQRELDGDGALPLATHVREAPGRGAAGETEGHRVAVGARSYVTEQSPTADGALDRLDAALGQREGLRAYVTVDGRSVGVVEYADRLRPGLAEVLADLNALGYRRTILLSGDHAPNVQSVAEAVGIHEAVGDLLPEGKVDAVRALVDAGERVLMVGDGVNDAPALSSATVGIALAEHGGGITAEAADIVILVDELDRVPEAVRIGRKTLRIARQSIGIGLGLSGAAMVVAALGYIPPALGALLQEAIDVAVILNALRTAR